MKERWMKKGISVLLALFVVCSGLQLDAFSITAQAEETVLFEGTAVPGENYESWKTTGDWQADEETWNSWKYAEGSTPEEVLERLVSESAGQTGYYLIRCVGEIPESIEIAISDQINSTSIFGVILTGTEVHPLRTKKVTGSMELVCSGSWDNGGRDISFPGTGTVYIVPYETGETHINGTLNGSRTGSADGTMVLTGDLWINGMKGVKDCTLNGGNIFVTGTPVQFYNLTVNQTANLFIQGYHEGAIPVCGGGTGNFQTVTEQFMAEGTAYDVYVVYAEDGQETRYVRKDGNYYEITYGEEESGNRIASEPAQLESVIPELLQYEAGVNISFVRDMEASPFVYAGLSDGAQVVKLPESLAAASQWRRHFNYFEGDVEFGMVDINGCILRDEEAQLSVERFVKNPEDPSAGVKESYENRGVRDGFCETEFLGNAGGAAAAMKMIAADAETLEEAADAYYLIAVRKDSSIGLEALELPEGIKGLKVEQWGEGEGADFTPYRLENLTSAKVNSGQELVFLNIKVSSRNAFAVSGAGNIVFRDCDIPQVIAGQEGSSLNVTFQNGNRIGGMTGIGQTSFNGDYNELRVDNPGMLEFAKVDTQNTQSDIDLILKGWDGEKLPVFSEEISFPEKELQAYLSEEEHYPLYFYQHENGEKSKYARIGADYYLLTENGEFYTREMEALSDPAIKEGLIQALHGRVRIAYVRDLQLDETTQDYSYCGLQPGNQAISWADKEKAYHNKDYVFYRENGRDYDMDLNGRLIGEEVQMFIAERFTASEDGELTAEESYSLRGESTDPGSSIYLGAAASLSEAMEYLKYDMAQNSISGADAYYLIHHMRDAGLQEKAVIPDGVTGLKIETDNLWEENSAVFTPQMELSGVTVPAGSQLCFINASTSGSAPLVISGKGNVIFKNCRMDQDITADEGITAACIWGSSLRSYQGNTLKMENANLTIEKKLAVEEISAGHERNEYNAIYLKSGAEASVKAIDTVYDAENNYGKNLDIFMEESGTALPSLRFAGNMNLGVSQTLEEDGSRPECLVVLLPYYGGRLEGTDIYRPEYSVDGIYEMRCQSRDTQDKLFSVDSGVSGFPWQRIGCDYEDVFLNFGNEVFAQQTGGRTKRFGSCWDSILEQEVKSDKYGLMVTSAELSALTVEPVAPQTYTGAALEPEVRIKDGADVLTKNTDYTVKYSSNINAGTASITITGIGDYSGTITAGFKINPKNISGVQVSGITARTYNGTAQTQNIAIKDGARSLEKGRDYTVNYSANVNAGTAKITITGTGNYGGVKTASFVISPKSITAAAAGNIPGQEYTGRAITPEVTVKDGTLILKKDKDYKLSYAQNTNAGKAAVTITGIGNYNSARKVYFTISIPKNGVYTVGNLKYQVTKNTGSSREMALAGVSRKTLTKLTVPKTVKLGGQTFNVTSVGAKALKGNTRLASVVIGDNVKTIQKEAFSGCTALKTLKIGKKVTTVGAKAFSGCKKLAVITWGSAVTSIQDEAFAKCTKLTKLTLPARVKTIGKSAFSDCTGLKTLKMGKAVASIGAKAFYNGKSLTSVSLSAGVTVLGDRSFAKCTKLTSVTIPSKVKTLGKEVFYGNGKLKSITIKSTVLKSVGKNCLKGIYKKAVIRVPKSKYTEYKRKLKGKGQASTVRIIK